MLGGTDGEVAITKDALGQEIGRDVVTGAEAGHDVQLTIDGRIQAYTEKVLDERRREVLRRRARRRSSWTRQTATSSRWRAGRRSTPTTSSDADPDQLGNMATGFTYEPGSTFKAFTVAGALEDGLVNPGTTLRPAGRRSRSPTGRSRSRTRASATGRSSVARHPRPVLQRRHGDDRPEARRRATSTSWVAPLRLRPPDRDRLSRTRSRGSCRPPDEYSGSSIGNLPIGQGLSVTPMQMMEGYAAIANGGDPAHPAPDRVGRRRARRPTPRASG